MNAVLSVAGHQSLSFALKPWVVPSWFEGNRCLHPKEGGFVNPVGMPNVRRAKDAPPVPFTLELQRLAFDVMRAKNPTITQANFDVIFEGDTALTNRHGVESDDPKLMDGIIFAGFFTTSTEIVTESGIEYLVCRPGIHAIDATQPLPTAQTVLDNGWWMVANTGQGFAGAFNFPQGNGGPVYVIYALVEPVKYPRIWFDVWSGDSRPDPLRYYR